MAQVDGDTVLIGVLVGEIAAAVHSRLSILEGPAIAKYIGAVARLHSHHRRAVLGKILGGHGASHHPAEVQDP